MRYVYNFKCSRCRYSRKLGHAKLSAETLATSHSLRLGHPVRVWESDLYTLDTRVCLEVDPGKEPNLLDEPPF